MAFRDMKPKYDVIVHNHGSIYLIGSISDSAKQWVDENVSLDRQEWCNTIVCEHRFVANIIEGLLEAGLTVSAGLNESGQFARFGHA